VFVLPARDEEKRVGAVVARIPTEVDGHRPVIRVVVDDGSTDGTATAARAAGAEVVTTPRLGLGAAVRLGLEYGVRRGAVVVAFCDADGEYAPEELEQMMRPILAGRAQYVVGSRFAGRIDHMRPHRRLGNRLLTYTLAWVTREPITDGQSGYRALSANAARSAEIAHDYNYAQVLTVDLFAKGFRYAEVPISYSFRRSGKSFIRPVRYLRHVVPTVWRLLNRRAPSAVAVEAETAPAR
jgi:glycosyltransferase involved in cell wall biosynthesis